MPKQDDDFERRSRLISLVYEVLRDMETPAEAEGATEIATLSALSQAFAERAIAWQSSKPPRSGLAASRVHNDGFRHVKTGRPLRHTLSGMRRRRARLDE